MQRDISPEEKLLSIIKGKQARPDSDKAPMPEAKNPRAGMVDAPGKKLDDFICKVLKNDFFKNSIFDPGTLRVFNKYMVIALVIIASYFILDMLLVKPARNAASVISIVSSSRMPVPITEKAMPIETKNYSYHSGKIAEKNIFSGSAYGQGDSPDGAASDDAANIKLVGIVPGENPQAIIEDTKNQKTYYLIKNQSVNDINVEDVSEGKVILEYRGKRMTLFL